DNIERRDCLDRAWITFLQRAGFMPAPLPNDPAAAIGMLRELPIEGLVFTGGNDIAQCGGDAAGRDATRLALPSHAREWRMPVLGVCRGMQLIQAAFGVPLERVSGHVAKTQSILINGREEVVNSFHHWGTRSTAPELEVWAKAQDGVVKAVRATSE